MLSPYLPRPASERHSGLLSYANARKHIIRFSAWHSRDRGSGVWLSPECGGRLPALPAAGGPAPGQTALIELISMRVRGRKCAKVAVGRDVLTASRSTRRPG